VTDHPSPSDNAVPVSTCAARIVAAADVAQAVLFDNAAIAVAGLLASCCLPLVFQRCGSTAAPLCGWLCRQSATPARAFAQVTRRVGFNSRPTGTLTGTPYTAIEIMKRLNDTACRNVLAAELAALTPSVRMTT